MARVMIVDDDPDIVESVTMVLQKNNHDVIQAYGGVEGLELSLIHISEPTRLGMLSRMPSSA